MLISVDKEGMILVQCRVVYKKIRRDVGIKSLIDFYCIRDIDWRDDILVVYLLFKDFYVYYVVWRDDILVYVLNILFKDCCVEVEM